jgi:catechol 2,3-dioxygenase-like lactoylglutathione lyase family enzyme
MLEDALLVAFVATTDVERARAFYCGALGLEVVADTPFALVLDANGTTVRLTPVDEVVVAPYTVLGWHVADTGVTVRALAAAGVVLERFDGMEQDDDGVWTAPGGDRIAWFRDPDGHLLSISGR